MRPALLWMMVLAGLPCAAFADGNAPGGIDPAGATGIETAPPAAPGLDLRLEPAQLPDQAPPPGPRPIDTVRGDRFTAAATPPADDRGLSFGVEVNPHRSANRQALAPQDNEPGLQDDIERLIEHSTLGLRGTYRF